MSSKKPSKLELRRRRQKRVRARIFGTKECPRLTVTRSLRNLYIQIIDDNDSKTLFGQHSKTADLKGDAGERKGRIAQAYLLGKAVGEKAKESGIECVVFDRAGYKYHGRVRATAEGARDAGLNF
ncbi:50S ribosomal protein L18 [Patescibacteria group bacterium]|nr:50S ribosomal protein L18 [Patescibacteria group bacterium]MBU1895790.1 50S ribosomal protein L18 [Patescibacteria group bacterium]